MLAKGDLQEVLQLALARGGDFADIFMEDKQQLAISCEDNKIERIISGTDIGAGIRVIAGDVTAYAYTNKVDVESLKEVARIVSHGVEGQAESFTINLTDKNSPTKVTISQRPDQVDVDDKVDLVTRANKTVRNYDPRIKQAIVGYGDVIQKVVIANSEGDYVEDERVRNRFIVNAVAADGNSIQTGFEAIGGHIGMELFQQSHPETVAEAAAKRGLLMLEAKPAPAGKMPVVMAGEAGGTMVHEACGHGLEADLVQKQLSVYSGKQGQKVASELVTVIDDATLPNKYGTYRFDDEGVASQECVLIKDGILEDYLYDRLTARKDSRASNGHGRRESYQHKPIPRMGNTYIASGTEDPEKIIADVQNGLLVKKMGGGQVNTTNGDFVFDVAEGFLIENGEVTSAVRGATLTGNGPEVLNRVERVGKDLGYTIGTCGKDGQGAPVSDAQPTMLISELIVGGTAHGEGPALARIRRI